MSDMHILHLSNDFAGSKVHNSLYKALSERDIKQTIYCPVRNEELIGKNKVVAEGTNVVYDYVIKPFYRYVYHIKRHAIFRSLIKKIDLDGIDLCHAATLFSDGGLAYKIFKKYNVPYVVAVRNTDISFLNKLPHTWLAGHKILSNAEKIIFISPVLMDRFSKHKVIRPILPKIRKKMIMIPNGVEDYFINHVNHNTRESRGNGVVYVGDFSTNKNVVRLCDAVTQLSKENGFRDIKLTLVGGGGKVGKAADCNVDEWIKKYPNIIDFVGPIYDKEMLCEVFNRHSLFAMPSIKETFGLVYLEALSQNLPVVYTKGQGIDGLFDESVGVRVNPLSVNDIKCAIKSILSSPESYSNNGIDFESFRWSNKAAEYIKIYSKIIGE